MIADGLQQTQPESKVSLKEITVSYLKIALSGFGGSLSVWAQRVVVDEQKWLSDKEFLTALALCRILPGPNQVNFAVYVGNRLRGVAGVIAALSGLIIVPFLIVVALGVLYFHNRHLSGIQSALFGAASAGAGMTISMGINMAERQAYKLGTGLITIVTFIAIAIFRYPLILALILMVPISILFCWFETKSSAAKKGRN